MPTGRLNMRRIRDMFSLGLSERSIAASLGLGKGSVGTYLRRARDAGLSWPLPEGLWMMTAWSYSCSLARRVLQTRTALFLIGR